MSVLQSIGIRLIRSPSENNAHLSVIGQNSFFFMKTKLVTYYTSVIYTNFENTGPKNRRDTEQRIIKVSLKM
jgi:hypothetical protein